MEKNKYDEKIYQEQFKNEMIDALKKEKRNNKILKIVCLILIILIILFYFLNKQNKNFGYDLYGESDNFVYYDSSFILLNNKYALEYGRIEIKNEKIDKITDIRLMCNGRLIYGSSQVLEGSATEVKGYNELFPDEVVDNIDDWYYHITYTINDSENTEIIPIKNRKWDKNLKVNPI